MLSKSDIEIVEKVLGMDAEQLSNFVSNLTSQTLNYLDNILDQYDLKINIKR